MRYEYLEQDYKFICNKLGFEYKELVNFRRDSAPRANYRDYYDDESISIVNQRFWKDINLLGYRF